MAYNPNPSEFEVQSLAFGILRKNLYPGYLIRGEYRFPNMYADIAVFKAHKDKEPELKVILEVKRSPDGTSTRQGERYEQITGVPTIYIRGYEDAYKVLQLINEYL